MAKRAKASNGQSAIVFARGYEEINTGGTPSLTRDVAFAVPFQAAPEIDLSIGGFQIATGGQGRPSCYLSFVGRPTSRGFTVKAETNVGGCDIAHLRINWTATGIAAIPGKKKKK